jgi:hypothetical protein
VLVAPGARKRSVKAHRALALECLRIVGASGYLSDEDEDQEAELVKHFDKAYPEVMTKKRMARRMVRPA